MSIKSLFLLIIVLIISIPAICQPSKGSFLMGSTFSFSRTYADYTYPSSSPINARITNWNLSPTAGYFVLNRWCVGVGLPYTHQSQATTGLSTLNGHSIGITPFVRYYQPLGKQFYAVFSGAYQTTKYYSEGYQIDPNDPILSQYDLRYTSKLLVFGAGLNYFFHKNIAIELMALYSTDLDNLNSSTQDESVHLLNINLGLQVYLHRKQK